MARWNERLHPRGKGGKFVRKGKALAAKNRARRAGNRPANAGAARQRRAAYTVAGVVYGVNLYGVAAGHNSYGKVSRAGRAGSAASLAGVTASSLHSARAAREVTSVRHAALTPSQRKARVAQLNKRQKRLNRASHVVSVGGIAAGLYGANPSMAARHKSQAKATVGSFVKGNARKANKHRDSASKAFGDAIGYRPTLRGRFDTMRMRARPRGRTRR